MKKSIVFISVLLLACAVGMSAQNESTLKEINTDEFTFVIEGTGEATIKKALPTPGYLNYVKDICTIPETVGFDGKTYPVTKIGKDAFKLSAVRKVIVPGSIKYIDCYAFEESLLSEIDLPETPLTLRAEAFKKTNIKELRIPAQTTLEFSEFFGCLTETPKLQNIFVDKNHPTLMDVDGVLCTRDGCLLACPSARIGTYVTPKEIKTTSTGAFYGSHLSTIVFSEGMEEVNLGGGMANIGMCREEVRTSDIGDALIDLNIYLGSSVKGGNIHIMQPPTVYNSVTLHFFNSTPCVDVYYYSVPKAEYTPLFNAPIRIEVPYGCRDAYAESKRIPMNDSDIIGERADGVTLESLKIEGEPAVYGDFHNIGDWYFPNTVKGGVVFDNSIAYIINTDKINPEAKVAHWTWYLFTTVWNTPSMTIPDNIEHEGTIYPVTEIDDGAFACLRYEDRATKKQQPLKIELNNSIRRIGRCAFQSTFISDIELPASLEEIDYHAFADMKHLDKVICHATTPPLCDENAWFCETIDAGSGNEVYSKRDNDVTLYVPEGCAAAYKSAVGWREFKNIVEGTTGINDRVADNADSTHCYYDLQGRLIANPTKGLYIQNGKKVVIK